MKNAPYYRISGENFHALVCGREDALRIARNETNTTFERLPMDELRTDIDRGVFVNIGKFVVGRTDDTLDGKRLRWTEWHDNPYVAMEQARIESKLSFNLASELLRLNLCIVEFNIRHYLADLFDMLENEHGLIVQGEQFGEEVKYRAAIHMEPSND